MFDFFRDIRKFCVCLIVALGKVIVSIFVFLLIEWNPGVLLDKLLGEFGGDGQFIGEPILLGMAVEDEELPYNPFNFELGKLLINNSIQRQALKPDQERKFLEFVKADPHFCRYYEGIYILFHTGLRIGELCGLTKSDIDFKEHTITVNGQMQRTRDGESILVPPKTEAGNRVLPMQKDVEDCFKAIYSNRVSPKVEPMVDGNAGFLYLDQNGNPMVPMHWEHFFKRICQKYNQIYKVQMPAVTPHVCRHTYCTRMAKSGIAVKTLQYLMGHTDVSVTLGIYTHSDLEDAQEELKRLKKNTAVNG